MGLRLFVRWSVVSLLLLGTFVALAPVRGYSEEAPLHDEILAYRLRPGHPLRTKVPPGVEEVFITTWALVRDTADWDPARAYDYSYQVRFGTSAETSDEPEWARSLGVTTRVSGDPSSPISSGRYAARTPQPGPWVTDSRTSILSIGSGRGGTLSLEVSSAPPGALVLARVLYPEPRGRWERRLLEETISSERRERLTSGRTSLGFDDLPPLARDKAVATWGRRLVAEGREGTDYFTQRLLLGNFRLSAVDLSPPDAPFVVSARRKSVLNFAQRTRLRLHGPVGSQVRLTEVPGETRQLNLGRDGDVDVDVGSDQHTVSVELQADTTTELRASVDAREWRAPLGSTRQRLRSDGRLALFPDERVLSYWQLHPEEPLVFSLDPSMPHITVEARASARGSAAPRAEAPLELELEWNAEERDGKARNVRLNSTAAFSPYERLQEDGTPVTESRSARLRVEPGMETLKIRGPAHVYARAWTQEPGVIEKEFQPPYGENVPEGYELRFAPHLRTTLAQLRPQGHDDLLTAGRSRPIIAHVRLEQPDEAAFEIEPRAVEVPGAFRWFDLREVPRPRLLWASAAETEPVPFRSDDGELECDYWFEPSVLGRRVSIAIGDRTEERLVLFATGTWRFEVPPGISEVALRGVSGPHVFLCQTDPPAPSTPLFIRRRLTRLRPSTPITIERQPGELLSVLVFVAAEAGGAPSHIRYRVDPALETLPDVFSRRLTDFSGTAGQEHEEYGRLWIHPAPPAPHLATPLSRYRIRLGDDLPPGRHTIHLSPGSESDSDLWFRAVVVGVRLSHSKGIVGP